MSKKKRTIVAFKELAYKYKHPVDKIFFRTTYCPLCTIHQEDKCYGCPLATKEGGRGCREFRTFKAADNAMGYKFIVAEWFYHEVKKEFDARAVFFEKYLSVIEKIPAERFTKNGWKFFEELDRND